MKPKAALAQGRFSGRVGLGLGRSCLWDRRAASHALALLGFIVTTENHPLSCGPCPEVEGRGGADFVWPHLHICGAQISVPRRELRGAGSAVTQRQWQGWLQGDHRAYSQRPPGCPPLPLPTSSQCTFSLSQWSLEMIH